MSDLGGWLAAHGQRLFGRSLSIREVDAGSCNGCELKIHALNKAVYDVERFGIRFVASPRHANVLLVTGLVTNNMNVALERSYAAPPTPSGWSRSTTAAAAAGGSRAATRGRRRR